MKVNEDILTILSQGTVEENKFIINSGQLDRKTYTTLDKALKAMGGKWNRSQKAHIFPEDPSELIDQAVLTRTITDTKTEFQEFFTPSDVVDILIDKAQIDPNHKCLEPSAGNGAIASAIKDCGVSTVEVCEIQEKHRETLLDMGFLVVGADFLNYCPGEVYDRIVANPPFTKCQDLDHVSHMLDCLKPGGIIVSVMSPGITFRDSKKFRSFWDKVEDQCDTHCVDNLPEGSFKSSGTMVNTVVFEATKK